MYRTAAQTVKHWFLTPESRVQSLETSCEVLSGLSDTEAGSIPNFFSGLPANDDSIPT
jgi:hypothetical protein